MPVPDAGLHRLHPRFRASQSSRHEAGHWAVRSGLPPPDEAWLTRRRSPAPLAPELVVGPKVSALSGGRTGDGSCLGTVLPRPLDGPFGPPRAGALAPVCRRGRQEPFRGPDLNPAPHPHPIRRLDSVLGPTPSEDAGDLPFWYGFEVSVHPRRPSSTRDAWRRAG